MRQRDDLRDLIQSLDDPRLLSAMTANVTGSLEIIAELMGGEVYRGPDMTRYMSGLPIAEFNGVALTNLADDQADAAIRETLARIGATGMPMYWWIDPSTRPLDLGARLEAHGLIRESPMPGMAIDITMLAPAQQLPSVRFAQVTNKDEAISWLRLSFGIEPAMIYPNPSRGCLVCLLTAS